MRPDKDFAFRVQQAPIGGLATVHVSLYLWNRNRYGSWFRSNSWNLFTTNV